MTTLFWLMLLVSTYIVYCAYPLYAAVRAARPLVARARPYTDSGVRSHAMLVLGDSTAVGVGSTPAGSIPGRLAQSLDASVENYAKSGAVTSDLAQQYARAQQETYDTILIQIGANDVVGIGSLKNVSEIFAADVAALSAKSSRIIVLTAGDIGSAPLFRWPLSRIISYRTRVLREYFKAVCTQHGAIYVDIYAEPNIIEDDPAKYHAADNFHLSDDGYGYWFSLVIKYVEQK
jgi:lysophospholipase L1-like esterase